MELLKRFSIEYAVGEENIIDDNEVTNLLNEALKKFIPSENIKDYRIINSEISYLPPSPFANGNERILCLLYIAYQST
jgi:hypothetical protein